MIQRIQSIYLLLIAVFSTLSFFLPMGLYEDGSVYSILGISRLTGEFINSIPLAAIAGISALLALIIIFLYKSRMKQLMLCKILFILLFIELVLLIFVYPDLIFNTPMGTTPAYSYGIIFPAVSFLLVFMATRAIRKDEEKVRAVDRIR
ncbi:MAG: DUF4293 domain-containing protein [Bacteroidota bacterium]